MSKFSDEREAEMLKHIDTLKADRDRYKAELERAVVTLNLLREQRDRYKAQAEALAGCLRDGVEIVQFGLRNVAEQWIAKANSLLAQRDSGKES